jgi:DNA-binding transcriptional LysR family regulator
MQEMQRYDFNLLIALDALLHERSVREAAERLNLTAPAMSHALARLRATLGDPLLVRAGRGLVPTQRALAMRDEVRRVVEGGRSLLEDRPQLELRDIVRTLTVRANGSTIAVFASRLTRRVQSNAPGLNIRFSARADEGVGLLRDGTVDLDIGVDAELGPEVRSQPLFKDDFVIAVRRGHPLGNAAPTLRAYADAEHVVPSRRGRAYGPIDAALGQSGLSRRVPVVVPDALAAIAFVIDTDYVATVPRSIAEWGERSLRIEILPLPFPSTPITVYQMWHPRMDTDRVHIWLRQCMQSSVTDLLARV